MKDTIFTLETKNTQYVLGCDHNGILRHLHWGGKARPQDFDIPAIREINSNHSALDCSRQEYTVFGGTMYRNCAFKCRYADGCRDSVFVFEKAEQTQGKLDITLLDCEYDIRIVLTYLYSSDSDVITRYATVINDSDDTVVIDRLMSAELTLPTDIPYDILNFNGSWGAEFLRESTTLTAGTLTFESRKGTAGHTNSPMLIASHNATEDCGEVYYAALGYGGNFKAEAQRDFLGITRVMLGISDFDFSYTLKAGERMRTPPVYMGYAHGFTQMTNDMNAFAVKNILPKNFADKPLPVLYNSWEATSFEVNVAHQLKLAGIAKEIGCELFVVDDGWFGKRNSDCAGLGDWFVNNEKFPNGIDELIDGVNKLGMDFGLWFEPEMVQVDSDLYRAHPDWVYHYPKRKSSELRCQLVLNLTRDDVKQYVFDCMDKMLEAHNIKYIKWDMNRPFSEIGTDNLENGQELWYRHTMAVYDIADRLKHKYPYLQLEACASGGARAEYGALGHFDMVWTSDNTDPVDRLEIQNGFSLIYPTKSMRAWVTDANKETRPVSLDYRFNVSMQGSLSIGSNLLEYTDEEIEKCKNYIALYKEIRNVVQFGSLYRLRNSHEHGFFANQYVSRDGSESVLFVTGLANGCFNKQFRSISLKGLDENGIYEIMDGDKVIARSGAYLMNHTFDIRLDRPFYNKIVRIKRKDA